LLASAGRSTEEEGKEGKEGKQGKEGRKEGRVKRSNTRWCETSVRREKR